MFSKGISRVFCIATIAAGILSRKFWNLMLMWKKRGLINHLVICGVVGSLLLKNNTQSILFCCYKTGRISHSSLVTYGLKLTKHMDSISRFSVALEPFRNQPRRKLETLAISYIGRSRRNVEK